MVNTSASANIGAISAATLSAGLTGTVTKVYDGGNVAALAAGNYTLTGVIGTDDVSLNNPATGTYDTQHVGASKTVSVSGLALTGASAGDYVVNTSASASLGTITPASLTAGLTGTLTKVYDGGTVATLAPTNYTLTGVIGTDAVSLNNPATGTYDTKDVGSSKAVSVSGLSLTGGSAGDYTVNASVTANIGEITGGATTSLIKVTDPQAAPLSLAQSYSTSNFNNPPPNNPAAQVDGLGTGPTSPSAPAANSDPAAIDVADTNAGLVDGEQVGPNSNRVRLEFRADDERHKKKTAHPITETGNGDLWAGGGDGGPSKP